MSRQVTIHLDDNQLLVIAKEIKSWDKLCNAIGYLSTWNMSYPVVEIYHDGGCNLVACYMNEKDERQYTIGAVWHGDHGRPSEGHYGFHS